MKINTKGSAVFKLGLEPGWCDKDYILQWVILKTLIDFIESERPYELFDIEASQDKEDWVRLRELYEKSKELIKIKPGDEDWVGHTKYDEITNHLIEVVRLRKMLWT